LETNVQNGPAPGLKLAREMDPHRSEIHKLILHEEGTVFAEIRMLTVDGFQSLFTATPTSIFRSGDVEYLLSTVER
jgi:hypothetical protein